MCLRGSSVHGVGAALGGGAEAARELPSVLVVVGCGVRGLGRVQLLLPVHLRNLGVSKTQKGRTRE